MEMLEERDNIGEGLVKGGHIGIGPLLVVRMQSVEQRVGSFVRHDIVREAIEDHSAGQIIAGVCAVGLKISKQQGLLDGAIVGVGLTQSMWVDAQSLHIVAVKLGRIGLHIATWRPQGCSPKSSLKAADRGHGDCIHHLLVELGQRLGWRALDL